MKRLLGFGITILACAALAPQDAMGQKRPGNKSRPDITDASPEQYALLANYKEMVGTVRSSSADAVVLRVEYDRPAANSGTAGETAKPSAKSGAQTAVTQITQLQKKIQKLQRDQIALRNADNPAEAQKRLVQLVRDQQALEIQLYRVQAQQTKDAQQQIMQAVRAKSSNTRKDKEYIDFELPFADKASIRRLSMGVEYDAKGNVKEMDLGAKGAGGLPGFAAKLEDLTNGVPVKVYLTPPKSATAPRKKDADGAILDTYPPNRPRVRMIVVLGDANAPTAAAKMKKNKQP